MGLSPYRSRGIRTGALFKLEGGIDLTAAGIGGENALYENLKGRGISTLVYPGCVSNWCNLNRPSGIFWMAQLDYIIILVRDATIAFETPETLDGEWANITVINMVESQWGKATTIADLREAFGE